MVSSRSWPRAWGLGVVAPLYICDGALYSVTDARFTQHCFAKTVEPALSTGDKLTAAVWTGATPPQPERVDDARIASHPVSANRKERYRDGVPSPTTTKMATCRAERDARVVRPGLAS